jgi:hypothetical protein
LNSRHQDLTDWVVFIPSLLYLCYDNWNHLLLLTLFSWLQFQIFVIISTIRNYNKFKFEHGDLIINGGWISENMGCLKAKRCFR